MTKPPEPTGAPASCDLLITGAIVLTLDPILGALAEGAVAIRGDRIVGVGASAA